VDGVETGLYLVGMIAQTGFLSIGAHETTKVIVNCTDSQTDTPTSACSASCCPGRCVVRYTSTGNKVVSADRLTT